MTWCAWTCGTSAAKACATDLVLLAHANVGFELQGSLLMSFSGAEGTAAIADQLDAVLATTAALLETPPAPRTGPPASRPIRVLHVINGEHYAGAERVQDLLALSLPEQGYQVGFACLKPGRFAAARLSQQAPLYDVAMRSRFDLRPVGQLARLINSDGYDLIHTHTSRSALLGAIVAAKTGVPLVHHIHSAATPDTLRDLRHRISGQVERVAFRRADAVIAVSTAIADYARRGGVKPAAPHGRTQRRADRRELSRKPVPAGPWTVGIVALLSQRKGLEVLLEAGARLHAQQIPLRLQIVGPFETPEYQARMHALAQRLGIASLVDWRGFRSDVSAELSTMDIFVMPSVLREGLPMVLLEAMAAGVPIVGSRVEGIPEVIRDREDGLLFTPGDAADLARAVARLVDGDADRDALRKALIAGKSAVTQTAAWPPASRQVYAHVLAGRARRPCNKSHHAILDLFRGPTMSQVITDETPEVLEAAPQDVARDARRACCRSWAST